MRRNNRHHRRSRTFRSTNEYSLYRNRIYLLNALCAAQQNPAVRKELLDWFRIYEEELESLDAFLTQEYNKAIKGQTTEDPTLRKAAETQFTNSLVKTLEEKTREAPPPSPFQTATHLIIQRFSLTPMAGSLLQLACCYSYINNSIAERLWSHLQNAVIGHLETSAILLGYSRDEAEDAFRELADVGIADLEALNDAHTDPNNYINNYFYRIWNPPVRDMDELMARLVGQPCEATLDLSDFAHLDNRDNLVRLLSAAIQERREEKPVSGVNILLYGRASTGKTEFAKTLACTAGAYLYSIGEPGRNDTEKSDTERDCRTRRRNQLRMAQALLRSVPDAAILCDEAEDVLDSGHGTRLVNHRLLENTPVPIIYTANRLDHLDESMLRRFTYILKFTAHSPTRQTAILQRMLEKSGIKGIDTTACARRLVDQLECPPAILAKAIETTRLINGDENDIYHFCEQPERTISTHCTRPRLGPPIKPQLPWEAFSHLGQDAEDIRRTLAAVLGKNRKGVNILLYGPPGTGKTEFARTLCGEIGAQLYAIGQNEIGPDARPSADRTKTLDYALEALSDEPNAVILFDEMEDFHQREKLYLNRIVEENPVPIIWACNSISYYRMFEPFFIDRMLHAIEFHHLPTRAREHVYSSILHKASIPTDETHQLAQELAHNNKITPRQVALAAKQATLVSGNIQTIKRNIAQKEKLRHGVRPPDMRPIEQYDPTLIHTDINLEVLTEQMVARGKRRFSLCLCGPPGTGKTAFVRYIAEQMGIDILPKRASDLLNKYVGENEQNIASAFAEALQTQSFLVFDEADSLLMDRQSAQRSWEVSLVNELLSQMERHPLPFACTTNQWDIIDPAAARRFVFRAEFYFLDQPRINRAFELFFDHKAPSSALALTKLTPADFANVRDRAEILGYLNDPERIAHALAEECRQKPGGASLGF
ncbi:MAG: AAA family ATPase [Gemmatimonadetes bacterium]|nr:AAA family ATPase [Gemmatimonadota bacterium]